MKKLLVFLLLLALVAFGLGFGLLWWLQGSLTVRLSNEQEQPISAIAVSYRGGRFEQPLLKPGEEVSFKPATTGGSGLQVGYTDSGGERHESKLDIYFEPEYRGQLIVHFRPGGEVVVEDRMNLH